VSTGLVTPTIHHSQLPQQNSIKDEGRHSLGSRLRNCQRKIRHTNYLSAIQHAAQLPANENISIYFCPTCGGLHLGHNRFVRTEKRIARALERMEGLMAPYRERNQQRLRDLCAHLERLRTQMSSDALTEFEDDFSEETGLEPKH
jgi:hypothetical protein